MSATWFIDMARNNAWANERLYGACAGLTQEELTQTRTSFFPTLLGTLAHLAAVDAYYIDGLEAGGRGEAAYKEVLAIATLPPLREMQRALDRRLYDVCEPMESGDLERDVHLLRKDGTKTDRAGDVLLHLFFHQVHHRGQVHAMLSGTRIAPPQLDEFFLKDERPIAERELAAAGFPQTLVQNAV